MAADAATVHASAVLVGPKAVLIRGPSGAGKSQLARTLLQTAARDALPFARLVADDRAHLEVCNGRLLVRPARALAGMIEIRGIGIRRLPSEAVAQVGLVVDLSAADAERHPVSETGRVTIKGVTLPRLAVAAGMDAVESVLAFLRTSPAGN